MVISENELNILKNLLVGKSIGKSIEVLRCSIEEIGLIDVNLEQTFTNELWDNYADKIIHYYTANIQKPSKRRLRKKIELLNAKKGFIIAEDQLMAKKSVKIPPEEEPKNNKPSNAKLVYLDKCAKRNIYTYFHRLNHVKEIYKIYNAFDIFENLKNYMLDLYETDLSVHNRLMRAKDFDGLCRCLPKMNTSKSIIKLYKFNKRRKEFHLGDGSNSIHAISIPMGGKNK